MPTPEDGFTEYRRLILGELERLNLALGALNVKIDGLKDREMADLRVDVAMLKVKASVMGAIAGTIGGAVVGGIAKMIAR